MKALGRWLPLCFALMSALPANAHPAPFSFLDLFLDEDGVEAVLTVHVFDLAHDLGVAPVERLLLPDEIRIRSSAVRALIGPRLRLSLDGEGVTLDWDPELEIVADRQAIRLHAHLDTARLPGLVAVHAGLFPYDADHQTFVNVYERDDLSAQAILDAGLPRTEYARDTPYGVGALVRRFVPAGVRHILDGPDHLLFLLGLLLVGGSLRQLLLTASAFTAAHSVTLAMAALGVFQPSPGLVEPAIALSIVCVGADNLLKGKGRDIRPWIALGFGLVHGFGFASVLREMGLPADGLGWSLFSFNLGVEIGQVFVVFVIATLMATLRVRYGWFRRRAVLVGSIAVIAAGAFWFVQRVFYAGGLG